MKKVFMIIAAMCMTSVMAFCAKDHQSIDRQDRSRDASFS